MLLPHVKTGADRDDHKEPPENGQQNHTNLEADRLIAIIHIREGPGPICCCYCLSIALYSKDGPGDDFEHDHNEDQNGKNHTERHGFFPFV